jgi:hypothetical protein
MNQRTLLDRLWSPAGFGLVLLLFLFPFLTVSCGAEQPIESTFTGLDLVIGGSPDITGPGVDADVENEFTALFAKDLNADVYAIIASLAVLAGMAAGLLRVRFLRHAAAAGLALVAGCLITVAVLRGPDRAETAWRTFADSAGLLEDIAPRTEIRYGFVLTVVVLGILLVANAVEVVRTLRPSAMTDAVPPGGGEPYRLPNEQPDHEPHWPRPAD